MAHSHYYIVADNTHNGPYDIFMLMRKMRNGEIDQSTMLATAPNETPKPITDYPELLDGLEAATHNPHDMHHQAPLTFISLFTRGWEILQQSYIVSLLNSVVLLLCVLLAIMLNAISPLIAATLIPFIFFFCINAICHVYLRVIRGQTVSQKTIFHNVQKAMVPLCILSFLQAALIITLPALLAIMLTPAFAALIFIPGCIITAYFAFAPFVLAHKPQSTFGEVMRQTKSLALSSPATLLHISLAFACVFVSASLILPLLFVLPIVLCGIGSYADEHLSE